ncbi:MAG: universal stress protein [Chloroflexota bacterium]
MRLLIATGGAKHSELALQMGALICRRLRRPPTVLTVVKHKEDRPRADQVLARARELLGPDLERANTIVRAGHPGEEIVREAHNGRYDLVVIGEKPKHSLSARMLGSRAAYVVEHAPCPVLIAKGQIGPIDKVLLCDSGARSESLLHRFLAQLPDLADGEVDTTVLHVMSQMGAGPGIAGEQLQANADELIHAHAPEGQLLERDIRLLDRPPIHPHPLVRHGLVVEEILAEAQSGSYDLVVIGAHFPAGWQRILLDNIAHQVIVHADRPVLVLR